MKLAAKFNLVFGAIFGIGLLLTAVLMYGVLERNARDEVLGRAALMMEAAKAMRGYTVAEVRPLLFPHMTDEFYPQTVPAYAATQAFNSLRRQRPDYTYKEATLNPTNPRDRAVEWESDIIRHFSDFPDAAELVGVRATPTGESLYLARPIRITNPACLVCHSEPANAPRSMVVKYGTSNGFGWKLNEVVGAQIVAVPTAVPRKKAEDAFFAVMALVTGGFVLIAVVLNVMLQRIVVRPARDMSRIATQVSRGESGVAPLPETSTDEMGELARSFNRMRRSLEKAMQMLD